MGASRVTGFAARPVSMGDAETLLEWRNDPATRRWARSQEVIELSHHRDWLEAAIARRSCVYRIIEHDEKPIASVRYDVDPIDPRVVEVSILVDADARGRGVGTATLSLGEAELRRAQPQVEAIRAVVHEGNVASRRLFERAGYLLKEADDSWLCYVNRLPVAAL